MSGEIIRFFLKIKSQLYLLHWQTTVYSRHKAYEEIYEELEGLIDSFVEIYQGKFGRIFLENKTIEIYNINDNEVAPFVDESINFLTKDLTSLCNDNIALLNIRDDMLVQFGTLKYLLTLE